MNYTHKKAVNHLTKADPALAKLIGEVKKQKIAVIDLKKRAGYLKSIIYAIISQQLSDKVASVIYKRFVGLMGKSLSPKTIVKTPPAKLREIGLSYQKISYIKELADKLSSRQLSFRRITSKSDEEIIEVLTKIKGIGRWTAEMFLIFSLGREDIFSPKDLGLHNAVAKMHKLKIPVKPEKLAKIASKWSPYRSYASLYLWASLKSVRVRRKT